MICSCNCQSTPRQLLLIYRIPFLFLFSDLLNAHLSFDRVEIRHQDKKSEMLKLVTPRVKVNDFRGYSTIVNSLKDGGESWAFVFQDCLDWKKLGPTRMEDWNLRGLKGLKFYRLLLVTAFLAKLRRLLMQC